jgi:polyhydroxyalkanoate synthase
VTFVLTSGGHNAGIVNPPASTKHHYQMATKPENAKYVSPSRWVETAACHDGSWWPAWENWLSDHSGAKTAPPPIGGAEGQFPALCDAPGTYVYQR